MLSSDETGRIKRRKTFQLKVEVQGGKISVEYGNSTGDMNMHKPNMHKPIEGSLSWGLGLHSMNDLPNIDTSLITLHDSMDDHTTFLLLV